MLTDGTGPAAALLRGTPVVPGVAYAPALRVATEVDPDALERLRARPTEDADAALAAFESAAAGVADGFVERAARVEGAAAQVLTASAGLARDRGLRSGVRKQLRAGAGLVGAVEAAVDTFVALFEQQGGLMAERVTDLRDIERRILARLAGVAEPGVVLPATPVVLVAADLAPSDTAGLDPAVVVGLVTRHGGATSHTAIIARQLGIPCVVGVAGALELPGGEPLLLDGAAGTVAVAPDAAEATELVRADGERRAAVAAWSGPAATRDGVAVKLLANVADPASARAATEEPVEGVGLFRTELSFLDRPTEPSVEEQAELYAAVFEPYAASGRHVVVRTLDAGSDKPIAFATHEGEENPALGVRGLRLAADNPALLAHQLDAVAEAAGRTGVDAWVMAPMVATREEAAAFAAQVHQRGLKAGAMVEVPAVAVLAHRVLEVVDFLSIGTNDLTQYTMAADRLASDLAHLTDPWQPAVLHLVAITAAAGQEAGKPVGVCGEAAADPLLACALVGMGVTSLSMAAGAVRAVGAQLARVTLAQCEEAAEAVLAADDPAAARVAARAVLEPAG
ncbi:phosphoenolpyruvate--protein phosphotransferase [Nocardioides zeae]|uniref:Phosphoenolpyruvate-protein phosphotransferase n=1 Tax=Nocardioides imazamoxiresistens TaxID=3231893 RepID=A0ABU3PXB7_9ACTN|nr:phosphoenolpyruvate--protein phosphotransferase [Nocardioides zeae]MDT9593836.1 phosphoenolpyruvate--protein phosphotransferase [Nocardioides zeae]